MMVEGANLLEDPIVWYTLAVLVFFYIFKRTAVKPITGWLDSQIAEVKSQLEQASRLRAEAAEQLEDTRRRQKQAAEDAARIVADAEAEAARLAAQAAAELKETLARHERLVIERIQLAEAEARAEVRAALLTEAMTLVRSTMAQTASGPTAEKLNDQAIADLSNLPSGRAEAA